MTSVSCTPAEEAIINAERAVPKFSVTETDIDILEVRSPLLRSRDTHEVVSSGLMVIFQSSVA